MVYIDTINTKKAISNGYLRFLKQMLRKKTRSEILDTNGEGHSIVERVEKKRERGYFAYIPAFGQ